MDYKYITNLPNNAEELGSAELKALSTIWKEKRSELFDTGEVQEFLKKLQREWAIETGIIERLYTWDRGVTEVLIEQGIDSTVIAHRSGVRRDEADQIKLLIDDQLAIVDGLFSFVKREQPLTEHYIRSLHAQFTEHQDTTEALTHDGKIVRVELEKGKYKSQPNNPRRPDDPDSIHAYCPPEQVCSEMKNLIDWYSNARPIAPEVLAAWLHHRFTQIHPFQDGNGRIARALATLVFLRENLFPLVIKDSDREDYIHALEVADSCDLRPLINIFVKRQKESILHALGLEQQIQQSQYADKIISSALEVLQNKYSLKKKEITKVYECAAELHSIVKKRFDNIDKSLNRDLVSLTPPNYNNENYYSKVASATNDSSSRHFFYKQIIDIANKFNYYANLDRYRSWVRLTIKTEENFEFVVSIHAYGHKDNGIMAVSAFTAKRVSTEDGPSEPINIRPACTDLYQFNYAEPISNTKTRFKEWLEDSLAIALAEWKNQISN